MPLRRLVPVARPPRAKAKVVVEAIAGGERERGKEGNEEEEKRFF